MSKTKKGIWNEQTAIQYLSRNSKVTISDKNIEVSNGIIGGLTSCGAYDFLKNHCGYN